MTGGEIRPEIPGNEAGRFFFFFFILFIYFSLFFLDRVGGRLTCQTYPSFRVGRSPPDRQAGP